MSGVDVRSVLRRHADLADAFAYDAQRVEAHEAYSAVDELMAEAQRVVDGTTDDMHYLRTALARCGGAA